MSQGIFELFESKIGVGNRRCSTGLSGLRKARSKARFALADSPFLEQSYLGKRSRLFRSEGVEPQQRSSLSHPVDSEYSESAQQCQNQ